MDVNITHICNAYPSAVWISFSKTGFKHEGLKPELNHDGYQNRPKIASWFKLTHGGSHMKDRATHTEYVTIVACATIPEAVLQKQQMNSNVLVYEFEVKKNLSFIITNEGEFQQQMHGNNNLWLDWRNIDHKP